MNLAQLMAADRPAGRLTKTRFYKTRRFLVIARATDARDQRAPTSPISKSAALLAPPSIKPPVSEGMTAKRVTAKRVTAKRVTAKRVTAKRMTPKRMTAHVNFPFLLSRRWPVLSAGESSDQCQEGRYAALCMKSRKKGSRKRTCPKVDMPKSR